MSEKEDNKETKTNLITSLISIGIGIYIFYILLG
jgi:hypothetical protein